MSITNLKSDLGELELYVGPEANNNCFYCGNKFEPETRAITWHGFGDDYNPPRRISETVTARKQTKEILLHPPCALKLCTRLIRDVHEAECRYLIRIGA